MQPLRFLHLKLAGSWIGTPLAESFFVLAKDVEISDMFQNSLSDAAESVLTCDLNTSQLLQPGGRPALLG